MQHSKPKHQHLFEHHDTPVGISEPESMDENNETLSRLFCWTEIFQLRTSTVQLFWKYGRIARNRHSFIDGFLVIVSMRWHISIINHILPF